MNEETTTPVVPTTKCPYCAEEIQHDAIVCKHCGRDLPGKSSQVTTKSSNASNARILTLIGAAGLLIGALLPWASVRSIFGTISVNGYEGDGMIGGAIGLILLIGAILSKGKPGKYYSPAGAILSVIALYIVGSKFVSMSGLAVENASAGVATSLGAGLYVSILGGLFSLIGGLIKVPGEEVEQVISTTTNV